VAGNNAMAGCDEKAGNYGARYWNQLAVEWLAQPSPQHLWRLHADHVNGLLLKRWLPEPNGSARSTSRVVKTDLFEEAIGKGQQSLLHERFGLVVGCDIAYPIAAAAGHVRQDGGNSERV
jgi:hypothetical protein